MVIGHFPSEPWSAGQPSVSSFTCSRRERLETSGTDLSWAGCPSCDPANSVKPKSIDPNQWPDLILSLSITGLMMEGCLIISSQLSDADTSSWSCPVTVRNSDQGSHSNLRIKLQDFFRTLPDFSGPVGRCEPRVTDLGHLLLAALFEVVRVCIVVRLNDNEVARLRVNDKPTRSELERRRDLVEHGSKLLQGQDPTQHTYSHPVYVTSFPGQPG